MKNMTKRKFISFFLAMTMLFLALPLSPIGSFATGEEEEEEQVGTSTGELANNIGKQAIFDWWTEFLLIDTETLKNSTAEEMSDYYGSKETGYENWVLFDRAYDNATGEPEDTPYIDANDLIVIIEDYHYDEENGFHWYKVTGDDLPEILQEKPWVYYSSDLDLMYGCDPYLAIYEKDEHIRIVNASVNSISSVRYVLAGSAALEDATISITDYVDGEYSISSLAYVDEENEIWSDAVRIEINKANGEAWSSADGNVSIRYTEAQIATNLYDEAGFFGAAYLYLNDTVYSAAVTDKMGYDVSDLVYTNGGTSIIVFELLIPEFDWFEEAGYFTNDSVTLYDNQFNAKEFLAAELPVEFTAGYIFTYNDEEYYWLENDGFIGSPYFLVKTEDVTLGKLPEEYGDGRVSITDKDGNSVNEITLPQYQKPEFTAVSSLTQLTADVDYQWQIEYEDGKWVDIYDENDVTIKLSFGMVATLLDDDGKVNIRCETKSGSKTAYSAVIPVTLEMYVPEEPDVVVSESFTTSTGETVTVTVTGTIPEDASVLLEETDSTGVDVSVGETVVAALDISIKNADGTEWQPESGETVTVALEASKIGLQEGDRFVVYHLHNGEVKVLGTYVVENETVTFDVDGFSKFVFALVEMTDTTDGLQSDINKLATINDTYSDLWLVNDPTTLTSYTGNWYVRAVEGVDYAEGIKFTIADAYVSSVYPYGIFYKIEVVDNDNLLTTLLTENPWVFQCYQDEDPSWGTLVLHDAPEPEEPEEPEEPAEPSVSVTVDGEEVTEITVSIAQKVTLTATPNVEGTTTYQWQILIPTANMWVNMSGQTTANCTVNYGMVANRQDSDGKAYVRCVTTVDGETITGEPIAVNITQTRSARRPLLKSSASSGDATIYNVVINYVFENGDTAATSYASKVGISGHLDSTVEFPTVQGYLPYVNDIRQDSYTFNLHGSQMTGDFVMTVVYQPTLVDYTVIILQQNTYNDNYTEYERKTLQALTGTVIESDEEVEATYPGFYQLLHKQVTIAADGSTVIEVKYDRYYYLMTFELGEGGFGVLPVYARYGTEIEVEDPTRPGYVFEHWIDGAKNIVTFPTKMPAHDIEITAVWTPGNAKYTIVYWKENADPNADGTYGYSYWGSRIVTTRAGSVVSGSDDIPTSITNATVDGDTVDEKQYFTYNNTLTDKNVVVKGDGTTVVNVYYTRNYYTIYFRGYGKCCLTPHTHGTGCNSKLICSLEEHAHTDCIRTLTCDIPEHDAHTADCLKCGKEEHTAHTDACCSATHVHTTNCYQGDYSNRVGEEYTGTINVTNPSDGYIYRTGTQGNRIYYIYISGHWYRYTRYNFDHNTGYIVSPNNNRCEGEHEHNEGNCNCTLTHTHIASCYKDVIHAHNESCYKYSCGKVPHTHTNDCYSACTIPAHNHGNTCNSNNTNNTIYVITAKYEADISDLWPTYDKLAAADSKHYKNNGQPVNSAGSGFRGWDVDNASAEAVSKRINMTPDLCDTDQGYQYADAQYGATYSYRLYYMFESFDQSNTGESNTRMQYNGVWYDSDPNYYQELMYSSNTTFNQKEVLGMNPVGREKSTTGSGNNLVIYNWLYYDRNRSDLIYQNIDTVVDTKTNIMFGDSLKDYQYSGTPPYPSTLEAGAYKFGGWYTTAGCFDGTEVDFDNATMPNGDMILYAKWEPVTHTVEFYTQKVDGNLIDKIGDTYEVKHNQKLNEQYIPEAPDDFENGAYSFAGWWYMDGDTERRFDFKSLPVTQDLVVYAKWTSNKQIQYNIHFQLANGTPVADSISSSDLAGTTITEYAKGGTDLYPAYREGYFPNVKSHSLTLDINDADGVMEYTFIYTPADAVPYTVYYVAETLKEGGTSLGTYVKDGKTYYIIAQTKEVNDNRLAYVSENFEPVLGYVPDEFQKSIVIVPGEDNTIVFYYSVDTVNAPYKVTHYFQNLDGTTWTVEYSYSGIAKIGDTYSESPLTNLVGFTYDPTLGKASGEVTENGLELKLYYVRNPYPYKVVYKVQSTGEVLYTSELFTDLYGKVVQATAPNVYGNYTRISAATQTITIRIEADPTNPTVNVITFYYEETEVNLNYEVVGPIGCGTVTPESESVKVSTGKANGSTATASSNIYKFVGWYSNKACTGEPLSTDPKWVPTKADGTLWVDGTTYYAKFEYNLTKLTIQKEGWNVLDPNQSFLFEITDADGLKLTVTVHANGSTTIDGLTVGKQYTITEKTDWSWRYLCTGWEHTNGGSGSGNVATITLGLDGTITFTNSRPNIQWLDGDSWCDNVFNAFNGKN